MNNRQSSERYPLTEASIDLISNSTGEFLSSIGMERKNILRLRLSAEEVMLCWLKALTTANKAPEMYFQIGKRMTRPYIVLSVKGNRVNPFEALNSSSYEDMEGNSDSLGENVSRNILVNMGLAFSYEYSSGTNKVTLFPPKKEKSSLQMITISIIAAILVGGLCRLLPQSVCSFLSSELISPLFSKLMGFLSAIAGPMIFFSILWGIYNIGDVVTLGAIGKKMIIRVLVVTLVTVIFSFVISIWFFPVMTLSQVSGEGGFSDIFNMLLDIIPRNLLQPFIDGNSLQIIFIAVVFGIALLVLGQKVSVVTCHVDHMNTLLQYIMGVLSGLVPLFVFISIINIILSGAFSMILAAMKLIVFLILCSVLTLFLYLLGVAIREKASPLVIAKKMLPTFLITITTASSAAAFSTEVDTCTKKLGISERMANFGVPLGNVLFKPGLAIYYMLLALFASEIYEIPITSIQLIKLIIMVVLLSSATPSVPGGALSCYTILFNQLGIPLDALAIAVTIDVVVDFFTTTANLTYLQIMLIELTGSLGMLDKEQLRKPNKR